MAGNWGMERIFNHGEGIYRISEQSDAEFPNGALWDALNVVYASESTNPESLRGSERVGATAMGGAVSGLFDYNSGTSLIGAATDGKFYKYTTDWAAGTGARATANSTTATVRWNASMYYGATTAANLLVLCNGIDAPVKYDGTNFTALGGSPPATGNFPTSFMGRLWMASGSVLYASAPNNCEGWTIAGGAKQMPIARGKDGNIVGLREHGGVLLVFKANSIYRVRPTATFTEADVAQVSANIGCASARTMVEAGPEGAEHFTFASAQGLEMVSATDTSVGVNVRNITRWVKPIIDLRNKESMGVAWSLFNIDRRELYHFYPLGSTTTPKEGLIGNFARSRKPPRWSRMDRQNLTAGTMFIDSGAEIQVVGDSSGRVFKMHVETAQSWAGSPFTSRIITPFHGQGAPERMKEYGYSFLDVQTEASYSVSVTQLLMRRSLPAASNVGSLTLLGAESGWGEGMWGDAVWGGISYAGERIRPKQARRGAAIAHIVSSTRWFRFNSEVIAFKIKRDSIAA